MRIVANPLDDRLCTAVKILLYTMIAHPDLWEISEVRPKGHLTRGCVRVNLGSSIILKN